jgi:hypothetical protein
MNRVAALLSCAIWASLGLASIEQPSGAAAAPRHATKYVEGWRDPHAAALGPRVNYPRPPSDSETSSERYFTGGEVNSIPFRSPAEALEIVPGLATGR